MISFYGNTSGDSGGKSTIRYDESTNYIQVYKNGAWRDFMQVTPQSLIPHLNSLYGDNGYVIFNDKVSYYWNGSKDVWKAFDGNTSSHGEYWGENQSNFWIGYLFNASHQISNAIFYGGNYSSSDVFEVIVEITQDGSTWTSVGTFNQEYGDNAPKAVTINKDVLGIRWRSPTTKTSGHNLFIYELEVYGN